MNSLRRIAKCWAVSPRSCLSMQAPTDLSPFVRFPTAEVQGKRPSLSIPSRLATKTSWTSRPITPARPLNGMYPAVFCPPIATFRDPKNAKADNLCEGIALSVECDQHAGKARQTLEAILGEPTVTWSRVASGLILTP